ncbi:MAG: protein-L-isoaspartate(D-aspartate) O-methyltransferase [Gammaproteobacteria bacterium]|jgi:protein-L-isoaspartate(D-aspartate) O-methyltransferase|nr:MAG: Protein-L-isoaspartate O-methyltransferase [Oceanospirillaceae bacterium UBA2001]|tara:strand:+ start:990 stop:1676 length:687 start_codon:yes stop_codon:yes gene_type:complete
MRHVVTDPKRTAANRQGIGMTSQRTRERLVDQLIALGVQDVRVLDVMRSTPRHLFLDEALAHRAYEDKSLPIGHNQTLSRPYTVARMSELLLASCAAKKVLEIGTGSGYQTSVLAQLVPRLLTMERIEPLLDRARDRLQQMGIHNVVYKHGDGYEGWPAREPFDGIMVTAAPSQVPQALQWQLAEGGCMIIPVGNDDQYLLKITRSGNHFSKQKIEAANFVPLVNGLI